jgi:hypothetical protein
MTDMFQMNQELKYKLLKANVGKLLHDKALEKKDYGGFKTIKEFWLDKIALAQGNI